ncbi:hypothetical protein [uncultured Desulfobacter sp.]|uniref:hypothetical protein n=1 Tax=uncultured Desulfobacter sp. TaxID=240139 RepID=UPI002AA66877|nr:hypothetical protein [uncultured Desulfobacter sp.]
MAHRLGYTRKKRRVQLLALEGHLDRFRKLSDNALTRDRTISAYFFPGLGDGLSTGDRKKQIRCTGLVIGLHGAGAGHDAVQGSAYGGTCHASGRSFQLAPGEGKTLALALVGALYGWTGRPCHVVTANDYLAERDAALMAPFYQRCGLSVSAVLPHQAGFRY